MKNIIKRFFVLVLFLMFLYPAFASMRAVSLAELVAQSESIVVAKVETNVAIDNPPEGQPNRKNVLLIEKTLKGTVKLSESLTFLTFEPPEGVFFEDNVTFPPAGRRVLVFFKKDADGTLIPTNGIQGVWPLEEGTETPLGMGLGHSVSDIEALTAGSSKK